MGNRKWAAIIYVLINLCGLNHLSSCAGSPSNKYLAYLLKSPGCTLVPSAHEEIHVIIDGETSALIKTPLLLTVVPICAQNSNSNSSDENLQEVLQKTCARVGNGAWTCNSPELQVPLFDKLEFWDAFAGPRIRDQDPSSWTRGKPGSRGGVVVEDRNPRENEVARVVKAYTNKARASAQYPSRPAFVTFLMDRSSVVSGPVFYREQGNDVQVGNLVVHRNYTDQVAYVQPQTQRLVAKLREFFNPGVSLAVNVRGHNFREHNILSLMPLSCAGYFDNLSYAAVAYPQIAGDLSAEFKFGLDYRLTGNSISTWRSAVAGYRLMRHLQMAYMKVEAPQSRYRLHAGPRKRRAVRDDVLHMHICFYPFATTNPGVAVGSVDFLLVPQDAIEFVLFTVLLLIGLPIGFIWTFGCFAVQQSQLRRMTRKLRLKQQRREIEDAMETLANTYDGEVNGDGDAAAHEVTTSVESSREGLTGRGRNR